MSSQRISEKLDSDMDVIAKFLRELSGDLQLCQRFLESPLDTLSKAGISLKGYATKERSQNDFAEHIALLVHLVVTGRVGFLEAGEMRGATYMKFQSQQTDRNWDHKVTTKINYQPMTDTQPGRVSHSKHSQSINQDISFSFKLEGASLEAAKAFSGPLISEDAFKVILENIKENLK